MINSSNFSTQSKDDMYIASEEKTDSNETNLNESRIPQIDIYLKDKKTILSADNPLFLHGNYDYDTDVGCAFRNLNYISLALIEAKTEAVLNYHNKTAHHKLWMAIKRNEAREKGKDTVSKITEHLNTYYHDTIIKHNSITYSYISYKYELDKFIFGVRCKMNHLIFVIKNNKYMY